MKLSTVTTGLIAAAAGTTAAPVNDNGSGAAGTATSLTMKLDWKYNCTPELLPLKREFNLQDYPDPETLATTVNLVDEYASKGDYGMALLQWYNVTENSQSPQALAQLVINDVGFISSQPGTVPGLKCLTTALEASPKSDETTKIIEAIKQRSQNSSTSNSAINNFASDSGAQCREQDSQASAMDCHQAVGKLDNLELKDSRQYQLHHGTCYIVTDTKDQKAVSIEDLKTAANDVLSQCGSSDKVGGTQVRSWGKVCISNRATGC